VGGDYIATHTIGFIGGEKNFEKKFGKCKNYILPLAGGWVCLEI
jgi:hypothetical protein